MTEISCNACRFSEAPAPLSAATGHIPYFTPTNHKETRKMLRTLCNVLITLAATLVAGDVSAQAGLPPPQPTING